MPVTCRFKFSSCHFHAKFSKSVCTLHSQHISMLTSHISSAQQPHVASGYFIETRNRKKRVRRENKEQLSGNSTGEEQQLEALPFGYSMKTGMGGTVKVVTAKESNSLQTHSTRKPLVGLGCWWPAWVRGLPGSALCRPGHI